jgi:cyclic-di-GMP phosphodiesterase, flagellum assembly factor TipF
MKTEPSNLEHAGIALAGSSAVSQLAGGGVAASKPGATAATQRLRSRLVLISIVLVASALAAIMYAQFDFAPLAAGLGGVIACALLIAAHQQIQKNREINFLKAELAKLDGQRTASQAESAVLAPHQPVPSSATQPRPKSGSRSDEPVSSRAQAIQTPRPSADASSITSPATGPQMTPRWEKPQPRPDQARQEKPRHDPEAKGPALVETALWPGNVISATDPMRDPWAFRPKDANIDATRDAIRDANTGLVASRPSAEESVELTHLPSSLDSDLELVQRKIKALADEVNAVELGRDRPSQAGAMPPLNPAIEKSVGALKATAESMRDKPRAPAPRPSQPVTVEAAAAPAAQQQPLQPIPFEFLIPATAERIAVSMPEAAASAMVAPKAVQQSEPDDLPVFDIAPPAPIAAPVAAAPVIAPAPAPLNPRLAAIARAIENGAMDIFLSPIVALQTHQVSHYDVTVRLKGANGSYIDNAEQELQLAGNDMLALFDTARLKRSAALAAKLDAHNKPGSLLSPVNGPSLTNGEFLETFAHAFEERDRIANQLVLTFTQADVEMFTASAWQALSNMHAFGFRFALAQIDHLAMDFKDLAKRGFAFMRLEARALVDGLPARDHFVGPDELCKMLAGAGMTLVADTIDDDAIRARVFGFGILYGQGRLFGGARQVKLDSLPAGSSAAA